MPTLFWIWIALALIFLVLELMSPTFIFFAFVGGSVAAGILTLFTPEAYYWQIGLFVIVSTGILPFMRKLAKKITKESPEKSNVDRMVGGIALVTQAIDRDLGGKVRFEGEIWQARASEAIESGSKVVIESITGTRVQVKRHDGEEGA